MKKITVVCHKDHSHGYEDFEGKCLLCVVDGLMLEIGNLMVKKQNFAPITDFISPSVVKAISKREWVGLEEEESIDMLIQAGKPKGGQRFTTAPDMAIEFGRLASERLKEKNGG